MITPAEIEKQCLTWWKDVLRAAVNGKPYFPIEIPRIGKVKTKDILLNLLQYKASIEELRKHSKQQRGFGYSVHWEKRNFEKIGRNTVPHRIEVETLKDYLKLTGKEKEYTYFVSESAKIINSIPKLKDWILQQPAKVIEHTTWNDTLKVCNYFLQNPKPNLYIRQLPIDVHTKYIKDENEALFKSLLDCLISEQANKDENTFEKRFNLKYAEPLIRIRFLDKSLSPVASATDLSMPLSEFSNYACTAKRVLVTENLMNFLTLPEIDSAVAIWSGGGFKISYLESIEWLKAKQFYYWGDIDAHGFQILNQFRNYFPGTVALMMDEETLFTFRKPEDKKAPHATAQNLPKLTNTELNFYYYLNSEHLRLEQEKIPQLYAEQKIREALGL